MSRLSRFWDPWRQLDRLQREMDRAFSDVGSPVFSRSANYPPINIWHDDEDLMLTAEVPGLSADDIDITVQGDRLTLRGELPEEEVGEEETVHRNERFTGKFSRTIQLPFQVDAEKTEASYEKGNLTLKLTRPEEQKPRKVTVKSGG